MPKVTNAYYKEKREEIISITRELCNQKPVFTITITDIIHAAGYSQGAIYRYYKDIDEIIADMLNETFDDITYIGDMRKLLAEEAAPEFIIKQVFALIASYVTSTLREYQKLTYELSVMHFAYPLRYEKIICNMNEPRVNESIIEGVFKFLSEKTADGYFSPKLPLENIMSLIVAAYDGIIRDTLLNKYYKLTTSELPHIKFDEKQLLATLCEAILPLLNGRGIQP